MTTWTRFFKLKNIVSKSFRKIQNILKVENDEKFRNSEKNEYY